MWAQTLIRLPRRALHTAAQEVVCNRAQILRYSCLCHYSRPAIGLNRLFFFRIQGHSSFITHIDWSKDGEHIRSNSGDYELLYCECLTLFATQIDTRDRNARRIFSVQGR